MTSILVGTDGSDAATAAMVWATGAAKATGFDLIVATALAADASATEFDEASAQLETWSSPAQGSGIVLHLTVLHGDPRQALIAAADEQDIALTVVGSSGAGWFPSLHLGNVGHHLAQHSRKPVVVVPPGLARFAAGRIIAGVDGSRGSVAALAWCRTLAQQLRSTVTAVHAYQPAARAGVLTDEPAGRAQAEQRTLSWATSLETVGVLDGVEVVEADPAHALIDCAQRHNSDLIVVGTRGAGGFHGLRLGSVALKILHHATRPVVLVPPDNA